MITKPHGEEISVTTANVVSDARLVRIYASAVAKITIANGEGTIGSFTVPAATVTIVEKNPTDTIASTAAVLCTPISYKS